MSDNVILRHTECGPSVVEERPSSFNELVTRLENLGRRYSALAGIPYAVDLVRHGNGVLLVGIGDGSWMLSYLPEKDGPALNSLGDESATGDTEFYFGAHTLVPRKFLISRSVALEGIRAWWDDGSLLAAVNWTDENF
jgi:hypothetical protein